MTLEDSARLKGFGILLALCAVGSCFGTQCWPSLHKSLYANELAKLAQLEIILETARIEHDAAFKAAEAAKTSLESRDRELKRCRVELELLASKASKDGTLPEPLFADWKTTRDDCESKLAARSRAAEWLKFALETEESRRTAYNTLATELNTLSIKERLPRRFILVPKP